jgi:hypothetical protein
MVTGSEATNKSPSIIFTNCGSVKLSEVIV